MEKIIELFQTYTYGLPVGVVALIVLAVGLLLKKAIFKLIGIALIAAAILFFVFHVTPPL